MMPAEGEWRLAIVLILRERGCARAPGTVGRGEQVTSPYPRYAVAAEKRNTDRFL